MMGGASSRRGLWLDPRTKILLLLFCILSAMMAPSLFYELGLVVLIGLLGVCFGKWKYAWKGVLFYALIVLLTLWIMDTMTGTWRTMFIAFLGLFHTMTKPMCCKASISRSGTERGWPWWDSPAPARAP